MALKFTTSINSKALRFTINHSTLFIRHFSHGGGPRHYIGLTASSGLRFQRVNQSWRHHEYQKRQAKSGLAGRKRHAAGLEYIPIVEQKPQGSKHEISGLRRSLKGAGRCMWWEREKGPCTFRERFVYVLEGV